VRALSLSFWFWIEPSLSNLVNDFLTIVVILHSLAFLLGLEVSEARSFTIPLPQIHLLFLHFIPLRFMSFIKLATQGLT